MNNLVKNPIFIGILMSAATYGYLYWTENKRQKANPKSKPKPVNLITPAVVGVISWFIASSLLDHGKSDTIAATSVPAVSTKSPTKSPTSTVVGGASGLHKISKNNIRVPANDVFIDLAPF